MTFEKTLANLHIILIASQQDRYVQNAWLQILPFYKIITGLPMVSFNKYIQVLFPETVWHIASNVYSDLIIQFINFILFRITFYMKDAKNKTFRVRT